MDFDTFIASIESEFPIGSAFDNPGGGTSTIVRLTETHISYRRGNSNISVAYRDLFEAYSNFIGQEVSSSDLRRFRPSVFDSSARPSGHSCNCTFLFHVLEILGLSGLLQGSGVRGNPYAVEVLDNAV